MAANCPGKKSYGRRSSERRPERPAGIQLRVRRGRCVCHVQALVPTTYESNIGPPQLQNHRSTVRFANIDPTRRATHNLRDHKHEPRARRRNRKGIRMNSLDMRAGAHHNFATTHTTEEAKQYVKSPKAHPRRVAPNSRSPKVSWYPNTWERHYTCQAGKKPEAPNGGNNAEVAALEARALHEPVRAARGKQSSLALRHILEAIADEFKLPEPEGQPM